MDRYLILQNLLRAVPGVKEVYFQPPASICMIYPCIRFSRSRAKVGRADNKCYRFTQAYELIVITPDPDSPIPQYIIENFQMSEINSVYVSENLYHTSITLYY